MGIDHDAKVHRDEHWVLGLTTGFLVRAGLKSLKSGQLEAKRPELSFLRFPFYSSAGTCVPLCDHRDCNGEITFLALKLASATQTHVAWGSSVDIPTFSADFPWSGRRPGKRSERPFPCACLAGDSDLREEELLTLRYRSHESFTTTKEQPR